MLTLYVYILSIKSRVLLKNFHFSTRLEEPKNISILIKIVNKSYISIFAKNKYCVQTYITKKHPNIKIILLSLVGWVQNYKKVFTYAKWSK